MTTIVLDWLGFRAAILGAVEAAMPPNVLATCGVAWADGPRPHARHRVLLSVVSTDSDDRDSALNEGGVQRLETMKVVVIQITAESSFDSGDADALWLIEQLRLGLRKVSVHAALEAAGVVIQVFPRSTRNIGGSADDRALSVHALEFTCCATFGLAADPLEDAGLVERAVATGTVSALNGAGHPQTMTPSVDVSDPDPEP